MQTDLEREQQFRFGGGGGTNVDPVALAFIIAAGGLILLLPRKYAVVPLFLAAFFIPLQQQVVVFGLHFMMLRVLVLFGWLRVLIKSGSPQDRRFRFRFNSIDKAVLAWSVVSAITFVLLWAESGAVIKATGSFYDAIGIYFLLRFLCREPADLDITIKAYAAVCAILALCMLNEQMTGRNLFSVFGGVPAFTYLREGKLRSQGAFAHPILAGTFCATLLPLFLGLWWRSRKARAMALLGAVAASVGTICSMSSTPVGASVAGITAMFFWPLRNYMRLIRWAIVLILITLHFSMNAPVWALIARIDFVGGSSGDHRYQLVNQFVLHMNEWWMIGTTNNRSWGFEMSDTSNWFVGEGVNGGFPRLLSFLAIIVYSFKALGRKSSLEANLDLRKSRWALGAALFSSVVAFLGISYFDQTIVLWYSLLAMISAAANQPAVSERTIRVRTPANPTFDYAAMVPAANTIETTLRRQERKADL